MKKLFTLFFLLVLSEGLYAQAFWTETFGTGCNQAQSADNCTATPANGAWTITETGFNDADANAWYISGKHAGKARGTCASHSCATNDRTLHIGAAAVPALGVPADGGATYNAGGLCGAFISICVATDARAESPAINCSGKSTITLSFNYIENGYGTTANGTVEYYDGTTWAPLVDLPKTPIASCNTLGQWTYYSIVLPASVNGKSNVKIGFKWINDDPEYVDLSSTAPGDDPSFAIDSIQLSATSVGTPPVAKIQIVDTTGCVPLCPHFTDISTGTPTSWLWSFPGATVTSSTKQNPTGVCYNTSGPHSVTLTATNGAGSNSVTLSNYINVTVSPSPGSITLVQNPGKDTLYCSPTTYTYYEWFDGPTKIDSGASKTKIHITHSGLYAVKVFNENNCSVVTQKNIVLGIGTFNSYDYKVSLSPNPATNELTIKGNWQTKNGTISVLNILGKKVKEDMIKLDDHIIMNVNDLANGVYFIQISDEKGRWTGRFVKD